MTEEREEMLKEDLERSSTMCLLNSFCRNSETTETLYLVASKVQKSRGVRELPPTASALPLRCCKTPKLEMRGLSHRMRRWIINNSQMTRCKKHDWKNLKVLELLNNEKYRKEINKEVTKRRKIKLRIFCVRKLK